MPHPTCTIGGACHVVDLSAVPELPEVETTRMGIAPHLLKRRILNIEVRRRDLRQRIPDDLESLAGHRINAIQRRGKYLVFHLDDARWMLVHLGMSGSLRLVGHEADWKKHDHLALCLEDGMELRYHDPRRFGLWLMGAGRPESHPLLCKLGPEPLGRNFTPAWLAARCSTRQTPIKCVIMDAAVVVGVGNIYASEALFLSRIDPRRPAAGLTSPEIRRLVKSIRAVLRLAIAQGGTTLRDFLHSDGKPGYFRQQLMVYERAGKPCRKCGTRIAQATLCQRSTYWCPKCQKQAADSQGPGTGG